MRVFFFVPSSRPNPGRDRREQNEILVLVLVFYIRMYTAYRTEHDRVTGQPETIRNNYRCTHW